MKLYADVYRQSDRGFRQAITFVPEFYVKTQVAYALTESDAYRVEFKARMIGQGQSDNRHVILYEVTLEEGACTGTGK